MNQGTYEGTEEEITFVKELNKNKNSNYWNILYVPFDKEKVFAIRVIHKVFGKINQKKVLPKADLFLAYSKKTIPLRLLQKKEYYLDENDMEKLKLKPIAHTGISVKRPDSTSYQILKISPSTFKKVFGAAELGAGASVFCKNNDELKKNDLVLIGWGTDWERFCAYFKLKKKPDKLELEEIKRYSSKEIHKLIESNEKICNFVFTGTGNFEEPFIATWFYEKGELKKASKIPFIVTTGSGRSHGDFTIVIKPAFP